jgi:cardiolipin synthase
MYHTNRGSRRHSKRLNLLREQTEILLPASIPTSLSEQKKLIREFSKNPSADLIYYLTNNFFFPYKNCNTTYYPNGETFFPDLLEEIKNAQKFIFLEFFIIDVDSSWNEILKALQERHKNGVEIRILCDGLGSPVASTSFYQKYLKSKGFESRVFLPIIPIVSTHLNNRDHRKIVIIDGKIAFTGGLNLANEYFNRGKNRFAYWKDNAVKIQGTAVHTFMQLFLQNWNLYSKTPEDFSPYLPDLTALQDFGQHQDLETQPAHTQNSGITIPYGDDFFNNKDIAENIYFYIINNAKKYLNITTPYILIDNLLQEALFFAAARGVEVSIIVPSVPDHLLTFCIGKTYLESFVDNGIKVYLYNKGFIHSKMFIADDHIATIGSVNLDYRSLYHHFENGVVFLDSPVVHDAKADFDETLKDCTHMQKSDYKKIPFYQRALGRLFRIFAPLF